MAWIKAEQRLKDHPKTLELMHACGWDLDKTLSKLQRFWWWAQDYAEDGDLRKHNYARIGLGIGIENLAEAKKFFENLKKCGWVDKQPFLRIHNWWEHTGPWLISKYKKSPDKYNRIKKMYEDEVTVTEQLPNGYVPVKQQLSNSKEERRGDKIRKEKIYKKENSPDLDKITEHLAQTWVMSDGTPWQAKKGDGQKIKAILSRHGLPKTLALLDIYRPKNSCWARDKKGLSISGVIHDEEKLQDSVLLKELIKKYERKTETVDSENLTALNGAILGLIKNTPAPADKQQQILETQEKIKRISSDTS